MFYKAQCNSCLSNCKVNILLKYVPSLILRLFSYIVVLPPHESKLFNIKLVYPAKNYDILQYAFAWYTQIIGFSIHWHLTKNGQLYDIFTHKSILSGTSPRKPSTLSLDLIVAYLIGLASLLCIDSYWLVWWLWPINFYPTNQQLIPHWSKN